MLKLKQVLLGRRDLDTGSPERLREVYPRDRGRGFRRAALNFPDHNSSHLGATDVPCRTGRGKGEGGSKVRSGRPVSSPELSPFVVRWPNGLQRVQVGLILAGV